MDKPTEFCCIYLNIPSCGGLFKDSFNYYVVKNLICTEISPRFWVFCESHSVFPRFLSISVSLSSVFRAFHYYVFISQKKGSGFLRTPNLYFYSAFPLGSPEEQGYGTRTGMASDGSSHGVNHYFAIEIRKLLFNKVRYRTGIIKASCIGDKALT